jgi:hypothetical protein
MRQAISLGPSGLPRLATSAAPPFSAGAFYPDDVSACTACLQRKLGAVTGQDRRR